jgi:hypothetical protein
MPALRNAPIEPRKEKQDEVRRQNRPVKEPDEHPVPDDTLLRDRVAGGVKIKQLRRSPILPMMPPMCDRKHSGRGPEPEPADKAEGVIPLRTRMQLGMRRLMKEGEVGLKHEREENH